MKVARSHPRSRPPGLPRRSTAGQASGAVATQASPQTLSEPRPCHSLRDDGVMSMWRLADETDTKGPAQTTVWTESTQTGRTETSSFSD